MHSISKAIVIVEKANQEMSQFSVLIFIHVSISDVSIVVEVFLGQEEVQSYSSSIVPKCPVLQLENIKEVIVHCFRVPSITASYLILTSCIEYTRIHSTLVN